MLNREINILDRSMEFFSEKELTARIGVSKERWLEMLIKEIIDNALDACENKNIAPFVKVLLADNEILISDNGCGLPLQILEQSLDYSLRVSDKIGYVTPSRGQQGNALKTLWAAPLVFQGYSQFTVSTPEYSRLVRITMEKLTPRPKIEIKELDLVIPGTSFHFYWLDVLAKLDAIKQLLLNISCFNPHASFKLSRLIDGDFNDGDFDEILFIDNIDQTWNHWETNKEPSAWWYNKTQLQELISFKLDNDHRGQRETSIKELIHKFAGLTSTAKAKVIAAKMGITNKPISYFKENVDLIPNFLNLLQQSSKQIKPEALGVIGLERMKQTAIAMGADEDFDFFYKKKSGFHTQSIPFVFEAIFCLKREDINKGSIIISGINFTTLLEPLEEVKKACSIADIDDDFSSVIMITHYASPYISFTDSGKTQAALPYIVSREIAESIKSITKVYTKEVKAMYREGEAEYRAAKRLKEKAEQQRRALEISTKDAASEVMEQAYMRASDNGRLPANARQIMYAARPLIIELTGKVNPWKHSAYFTQTLLPDYINNHDCSRWDVVYDARGHFKEPHTDLELGIGTCEVRSYINKWSDNLATFEKPSFDMSARTSGPALRYRYALFIEKEGFDKHFQMAGIQSRYDLAIFSTKGMSVTAARQLVERLSLAGVTILVLHDFDESGFIIKHTLQTDTRRYHFSAKPKVIDLGLRLDDVHEMNLESEAVEYRSKINPRDKLKECGATEEELKFLVSGKRYKEDEGAKQTVGKWVGKRVELNAMDSRTFIEWVEKINLATILNLSSYLTRKH